MTTESYKEAKRIVAWALQNGLAEKGDPRRLSYSQIRRMKHKTMLEHKESVNKGGRPVKYYTTSPAEMKSYIPPFIDSIKNEIRKQQTKWGIITDAMIGGKE
jgi:hypothetical protein